MASSDSDIRDFSCRLTYAILHQKFGMSVFYTAGYNSFFVSTVEHHEFV